MATPSEQVKDRLDVAEVIGGYVKLSKSGANLKGLCPFHHEKTPSFYVSRDKQIWHCFGCNIGGDIFSFITRVEGIEFPEALRMLAERAGIQIREEDPIIKSERSRLFDIVRAASAFYEECLGRAENSEIREYLHSRGLADETKEDFHIGYAQNTSWDSLVKHLAFKRFRPEEVERAGVAVRNERGEYRDRFHNRIMFPLYDAQNNAVGFSGRHFEARHPANSSMTPAKYVNTPETLIYNKSKILYGLHAAKNAIREKGYAVLVEGQFDLVLSHQAGVKQTVATSGTALTQEHIKLLKRYASQVRTAFDNDSAGQAATKRSVLMFLSEDVGVNIISIDSGKDPADLVRTDPALWTCAVENSVPLFDFYVSKGRESGLKTPEAKRAFADGMLPIVQAFANPVLRGHYIEMLAEATGIDGRFLNEAMQNIRLREIPAPREKTETPRLSPRSRWTDMEEYLVAFLAKHRDLAQKYCANVREEFFAADHTRTLFRFVAQNAAQDGGGAAAPEELRSQLDFLILKADRYAESAEKIDAEREIEGFIRELSCRSRRERLKELAINLKDPAMTQDLSSRAAVLEEFKAVSTDLQRIEKGVK